MSFDLSNGIDQSINRCAELRSPFQEQDVVADLLPRIPRESREEAFVQALKMTVQVRLRDGRRTETRDRPR
jgi:hypothetical protein